MTIPSHPPPPTHRRRRTGRCGSWGWGYPCMVILATVVLCRLPHSVWMFWNVTKGGSSLSRPNRRGLLSVDVGGTTSTTITTHHHHHHDHSRDKKKILYIVTAGGKRATGTTRFVQHTQALILESVSSLMENPTWHVDVYLILGYAEAPWQDDFQHQLQAIHPKIQLRVWREAVPLFYACDEWRNNRMDPVGRGTQCRKGKTRGLPLADSKLYVGHAQLARQHRLVVKDFLADYDFFLAFEDDMLINKYHVEYHMEWMATVRRMHKESKAREQRTNSTFHVPINPDDAWKVQELHSKQLLRLRPAFLRVEVSEKTRMGPAFGNAEGFVNVTSEMVADAETMINASRCCHRPKHVTLDPALAENRQSISANDLLLWETSILGYGIRRLGNRWIGTLPGPRSSFRIPDYWSGRILHLSAGMRPSTYDPHLISQSAGWMGTRREILEFNEMCHGSFLPPFDAYPQDGLWRNNVEYWSGGIQLWSATCNIARFVDLQQFDRHLVYHTSNNKHRGRIMTTRIVSASVLLAQLLVAQKAAESDLPPNV